MTERILVVDDGDTLKETLELMLAGQPYQVLGASSGAAALERIEATGVDVVLCELRMTGLDGLDLLPQIARRAPDVPVILTSSQSVAELAAEAMRRSAFDSLAQPFGPEQIQFALRRAREHCELLRSSAIVQRDLQRTVGERPIVAASPPMIELLEALERTAALKAPALLTGEAGTGKEVLARVIHAQSTRRNAPFVAVGCQSSAQELLQAELFGHAQGAVSGLRQARRGLFIDAEGGTLYLDAVDRLPMPLQRELLRVLQEEEIRPIGESKARPVDVRIIAGTASNLSSAMDAGRFNEALLQRLAELELSVPALRDRQHDIPLLVDHFMARFCETLGRSPIRIADDALERLTEYSWPGNIRELENVIERAIILADGDRITLRQLPANVVAARREEPESDRRDFSLKRARRVAEAEIIERALSTTHGNRTHAAKLLDISHRALLYKIKDYRIRN